MKTITEIRAEAHELYNKSSHYVVGTFFAIMLITAVIQSLIRLLGTQLNIEFIIILSALLAPLELGMVQAVSLAYQKRAREVKTNNFTLMGLKQYATVFGPFVGKTIVTYLIQIITVSFFVVTTSRNFHHLSVAISTILSGDVTGLRGAEGYIVPGGVLIGCILSLIIGFFVEAYFAFSYYVAVEKGYDLKDSILYSTDLMKGNIAKYIALKLSYLPFVIISAIVVKVCSSPLQTMFQQMIVIIPQIPIVVYNIMLTALISLISAGVSVMLYKVKEYFAIYCFYKELDSHYVEQDVEVESE